MSARAPTTARGGQRRLRPTPAAQGSRRGCIAVARGSTTELTRTGAPSWPNASAAFPVSDRPIAGSLRQPVLPRGGRRYSVPSATGLAPRPVNGASVRCGPADIQGGRGPVRYKSEQQESWQRRSDDSHVEFGHVERSGDRERRGRETGHRGILRWGDPLGGSGVIRELALALKAALRAERQWQGWAASRHRHAGSRPGPGS